MKIALIITGQLGKFTFKENKNESISERWKRKINEYNIDVFAVTEENNYYDIEEDTQIFSDPNFLVANGNCWRLYKNKKLRTFEDSKRIIENILINSFQNKLKKYQILNNSKFYNIDNYKDNLIISNNHKVFYDYRVKSGRNESTIFATLSQFYKINECFKLMKDYENENNFKYDIIIRSRFDTICQDYFILDKADFSNTIYSPKCERHIFDWFCIGNRKIMEKYCCHYLNYVPNLIDNYQTFLYHENNKIVSYKKGYNIKKEDKPCHDISDSAEVGLTYMIEIKNKYKIEKLDIIGPLKVWS